MNVIKQIREEYVDWFQRMTGDRETATRIVYYRNVRGGYIKLTCGMKGINWLRNHDNYVAFKSFCVDLKEKYGWEYNTSDPLFSLYFRDVDPMPHLELIIDIHIR